MVPLGVTMLSGSDTVRCTAPAGCQVDTALWIELRQLQVVLVPRAAYSARPHQVVKYCESRHWAALGA